MSAYLKFFQLERSPFDTGSQSSLVLGTQALRSAYSEIEAGIAEGAPRICVNGGSGLGKTSLARALPKLLKDTARVVLLLNPSLPWSTLRAAIVKQLDLEDGVLSRQTLVAAREAGRTIVLVIDAAETIDRESLEHLDILLAYRTDDDEQLVHCVLLANLERARSQDDCPLLWWLDGLNTLQLEFAPIPVAGVRSYIVKHLKRAGWTGGELFTAEAARAIHRLTGGVPRSLSELCERVLASAAEQGLSQIGPELVGEVAGERPPGTAAREQTTQPEPTPQAAKPAEPRPAPSRAPVAAAPTDAPASSPPTTPAPGSGLDAYFGPESEPEPFADPPSAATTPAPIPTAKPAAAEGGAEQAGSEEWTELDVESRGGLLRRAAIAAVVVAALGVGAWQLGLGSDEPEPPAPVARRAPKPPPTAPQPATAGLAAAPAARPIATQRPAAPSPLPTATTEAAKGPAPAPIEVAETAEPPAAEQDAAAALPHAATVQAAPEAPPPAARAPFDDEDERHF